MTNGLAARLCATLLVLASLTPAAWALADEPARLAFGELFAPGTSSLTPSARLRSLDGARVRMRGFMALLAQPSRGSFFLTPRPVECDEAGGGTADLPPSAVRVVVPSARGRVVPHVPGLVEVTGVLALDTREDEEHRRFSLHLTLDPAATPGAANRSGNSKKGTAP